MRLHSKEFWLVAFFFSKFGERIEGRETQPPVELNTKFWGVAYRKFYHSLGEGKERRTFENGLKNCRDAYDGHIATSGRVGWKETNGKPVKLTSTAKSVFNKYSTLNRNEIWQEIQGFTENNIKKIIDKRKNRNPDWIREELILALDLYFKLDYGQMHGRNSLIIQLSEDLRNLNIHQDIPDKAKFRSVNSVALKLANLKKSDQNFSGKGMKDGGRLEKEIWTQYHTHRDKLSKEAVLIRQIYLKPQSDAKVIVAEKKIGYKSEFLFQVHKNRETDPLAIKVKKEIVLATTNKLKCEVCGFDSHSFYGEIGDDLMEIHYDKELKNEPRIEQSEMNDFVIVCSNCHKTLDKNFGLIDAADLKKLIRKNK